MDGWVDRIKVNKIRALIDKQIVNRTEQLTTFVMLKRAIEARLVNGDLRDADIEYIRDALTALKIESRTISQLNANTMV